MSSIERRIVGGTFRLSLVVAALVATHSAYQMFAARQTAIQSDFVLLNTLKCGASVPEERLRPLANPFGNVDLARVGCADRQFWASFDELARARDGRLEAESMARYNAPFDYASIGVGAGVAFLATNAIGIAVAAAYIVMRWVGRGYSQ